MPSTFLANCSVLAMAFSLEFSLSPSWRDIRFTSASTFEDSSVAARARISVLKYIHFSSVDFSVVVLFPLISIYLIKVIPCKQNCTIHPTTHFAASAKGPMIFETIGQNLSRWQFRVIRIYGSVESVLLYNISIYYIYLDV